LPNAQRKGDEPHGELESERIAAWAETDIGRFHQRLSLLMVEIGVIFSLSSRARAYCCSRWRPAWLRLPAICGQHGPVPIPADKYIVKKAE
jgi:hypothetical protein